MAESLADLLKSFRSVSRLSQEALAERAGVSTRTVSDIETGFARTPRLMTVMLLAEALELTEPDRERLRTAARRPGKYLEAGTADRRLPQPVPLVGRDADAAACASILERGTRLLTLSGPAGVGKTSLAIRIASELAGGFTQGSAFVELAAVADPARIPATIAEALGLRETPGTSLRETLAAALRDRHLLLVLDTFEHLVPGASWIGELLADCDRLTVLVTSREPLRLRREQVYSLQPLPTADALALFVQRAQLVKPEFAVTASNRRTVESIVTSLEGLPLAIELAAPRLTILAPAALAARLERRLPLLGDGPVDLPQRQRTMRGAISWSYDLLSNDEQRLFRQISVLRGGSVEAARAVANASESEQRPFLLRLADLVDKSLLLLQEDADGEPRVVMLEMLREFAHERLSEDVEEFEAARRSQGTYFLALAEHAASRISGSDQRALVSRLEREHANVRAALQWTLDEGEIELGLRLATAVWRFWWIRGNLSEARYWLGALIDRVESSRQPVAPSVRAKALRALVVMLSGLGDFEEALGPCQTAIRLQREIGDADGLASSLTSLGIMLHFQGDNERARVAHEESLTIRRGRGEELGIASSLSNLASIAYAEGTLSRAAELAEESARIRRRHGDNSALAHSLLRLGLVKVAEGAYESAGSFFEESLSIQQALGDAGTIVYSIGNLATVAHRMGNLELALERYRQALEMLRAIPSRVTIATVFEGYAGLLVELGDPRRAARILGAASSLRQTVKAPMFAPERASHDATMNAARDALGSIVFKKEWTSGTNLNLRAALDEALEAHPAPA